MIKHLAFYIFMSPQKFPSEKFIRIHELNKMSKNSVHFIYPDIYTITKTLFSYYSAPTSSSYNCRDIHYEYRKMNIFVYNNLKMRSI